MLTSKQRAYLRGLANTIPATQQIGKDGVTENVAQQVKYYSEICHSAQEKIRYSILRMGMMKLLMISSSATMS